LDQQGKAQQASGVHCLLLLLLLLLGVLPAVLESQLLRWLLLPAVQHCCRCCCSRLHSQTQPSKRYQLQVLHQEQ
jgi:hypothetical protein